MSLSAQQRSWVRQRANNCCEYCRLPQKTTAIPFHVDHIRPLKHDGNDEVENLCLACYRCNGHKGADFAGFDPLTDEIVPLFHPRQHLWSQHFELDEQMLIMGLTAIGRTTVKVLNLNDATQVQNRQLFFVVGVYPC